MLNRWNPDLFMDLHTSNGSMHAYALESVLAAVGKRYLLADLPRKALKEVKGFLPGVAGPTVVDIAGKPDLVAIQVVVDEAEIYDAVHRLRQLGGRGILVVPIDRMVA